jgi:hypothetical protein
MGFLLDVDDIKATLSKATDILFDEDHRQLA